MSIKHFFRIQAVLEIYASDYTYACIHWNSAWAQLAERMECEADKLLNSDFFSEISTEVSEIFSSVLQVGVEYACLFYSNHSEGFCSLKLAPISSTESRYLL